MQITGDLLLESKSARDQSLSEIGSHDRDQEILTKVKSLFFALWEDIGRVSRQQVADFYEVSVETIDSNHQRHSDEFESDGAEVLSGKELRALKRILRLSASSPQETVYTPRAVLRMGFILRDSEVAKQVRTAALNVIQGVGQLATNRNVIQRLIVSHPSVVSFVGISGIKLSAPLVSSYSNLPRDWKKRYKDGGIRVKDKNDPTKDYGISKDDIRDALASLSTRTDNWSLKTQKELQYKLGDEIRGKYPDLMSQKVAFDVDGEKKTAAFIFQIYNFMVDVSDIEQCIARRYIQLVKEGLGVDYAALFFVSPFGLTPSGKKYIETQLSDEINGCVGSLLVKELASFLSDQVTAEKSSNLVRGETSKRFSYVLTYDLPVHQSVQLSLFLEYPLPLEEF